MKTPNKDPVIEEAFPPNAYRKYKVRCTKCGHEVYGSSVKEILGNLKVHQAYKHIEIVKKEKK